MRALITGFHTKSGQMISHKQMKITPMDPITLSDDEQGVYNHLRNERYLGSINILSFGDWIPRALGNI